MYQTHHIQRSESRVPLICLLYLLSRHNTRDSDDLAVKFYSYIFNLLQISMNVKRKLLNVFRNAETPMATTHVLAERATHSTVMESTVQ